MAENEQSGASTDSREEILEDHRHVRASLGDLEKHISQEVVEEAPWRERLSSLLSDFEKTLRAHFLTEENGGLFDDLRLEAPRLARRIDQVMADHPVILERLEKLRAGLSDGDGAMSAKALAEETSMLVVHLGKHEAEENELMMGAFLDDLGGRG